MIKDAIDIVDLVSQYTTLMPAGKRMKGLSPFTNEKTPSFFVDPTVGVYYCFSSQKGGDIFTFVQETEGVDFREALKMLADRAGIDLLSTRSERRQDNTTLYHLLESAASVYQKNLTDGVRNYLLSRGMSNESIKVWSIGYAPDAWNTICTKQMPNLAEQVKVGMCVQTEKSVYDRFRNRVQFPFYDEQGRVIGFSGRIYGDGDGAKYINSPESPLFNKSAFLYGLHKAKPYIRKHNVTLLTEGPIDVIMAHQAGYPMTVATSGTAVTGEHLRTLRRLSNRLLIVMDSDAAGNRAALRIIEMTFALNMDSKVVVLPNGSDPADSICEDVQKFKTAVKEALSATAFLTHYVAKVYGNEGEDRIRGVKEVILPIIASNKDPLMRGHAVQEIASFCGLRNEMVEESLRQTQSDKSIQEDTSVLRREIPVSKKKKDDDPDRKARDLFTVAALAVAFLKKHEVALTEEHDTLFQNAQEVFGEKVSGVNEKVAEMRYEERFSDRKKQVQGAQTEMEDMLKQLNAELKKRGELRKSQGIV